MKKSTAIKLLTALSATLRASQKVVGDREGWNTVNGAKVLIGKEGKIQAGMGGKFTGKTMSQVKKTDKSSAAVSSKPKASEQTPSSASSQPQAAQAPSQPVQATQQTQAAATKAKKETPKQKATREAAEISAKHEAAKVDMSPREIDAMKAYSGSMYRDLNSRLRAGKNASREDAADLKQMDKVFERASTKEPITVFRGVGPEMAAKLKAGASFTDGGFSSGTASRDIAEAYSSFGGDGGALMEIRVPKGAKAVSLKETSAFGGSSSKTRSEEEILLNRGSNFRVVEVVQDPPRLVKGRLGSRRVTPPPRIVVELE